MITVMVLIALGAPLQFTETCDKDEPWSCIQPLRKGEVAPFTGQLYTFTKAAKQASKAGGCPKRIEKVTAYQKSLTDNEIDKFRALLVLERRSANQQVGFLNQQIATMATPWYKEPVTVVGTTMVVMTAVFAILGGT